MKTKNTKTKSEIYRNEILDNLPVGLYRITDEGILVSANKELAVMFGFNDPEELIDQPVLFIYENPAHRSKIKKLLNEKGEVKNYTTRLRKKDGRFFWVDISARVVFDKENQVKYYDGIILNVDRQMEAEQNLQRSEVKFRDFFRNIRDAIIVTDKQRNITDCNPAFTELFGYTADEVRGKNTQLLYTTNQQYHTVGKKIKRNIAKDNPFIYSVEYQTKSGKVFTGESGIFYMRNEAGDVTGYIATIRDDTQRSRAEKSLLKAKQKAEEADRLKTAFIANMSHEIRTPMNAILGFAEFLTDPELSRTELRDFVKIIQENGSSLISLIDDIMDVSRIESGEMKIDIQEYEMNETLRNLYNTIIPHFKPRSSGVIETRLKLQKKDSKILLKTDVQRLRQVLYNLLSNAFKFTDKGLIELGYEILPDNRFRLYVKDTGIGIETAKQKLIFDRFRQVDESRTKKYSGTGIGLTITKKLTEMLEGKIWVESSEDIGSVFYCEFPGARLEEPSVESLTESPVAQPIGDPDLSGKTILVAEDYESNYYFLEAVLKNLHANVIWCKDGKEVVEALSNGHHVDMVLMDVQMPVMSGNEALQHIRRNGNKLPVIAQTAYATNWEMQECLKAGYNDYLTKPIRIKKLMDTITKYF